VVTCSGVGAGCGRSDPNQLSKSLAFAPWPVGNTRSMRGVVGVHAAGFDSASEGDRRVFQPSLVLAGINKVIETKETKPVRAGRGVRAVETVRRQLMRTFRWKDLRHTFASRLRMTGVELGTIRDLPGHTA
jgi:hypothetical protein